MTSLTAVDFKFQCNSTNSQSPYLGYEEMFELMLSSGAKEEKGSFDRSMLKSLDNTHSLQLGSEITIVGLCGS
jgi:hypothetical protein